MIALRTLILSCCLVLGAWLPAADTTPPVESSTPTAPASESATPATAAPATTATEKRIAYVQIDGVIDPGKVAYYRRALDAAIAAKVDAVVVHLTTPGGRVDSAEEMTKAALAMPEDGPLMVAFVDRESYSAGSLIAYAHHRVYVTEVATIGNIGVIMQTPEGKIEYGPEKIETVIRTLLRSVAQKNGWDDAKLQKMTARNQDLYRFDLKDGPVWVIEDDLPRFLAAHPDIKTEQKVLILGEDRLLSYTAKEALAEKMASGLVKDLNDLYRTLGGSSASVVDLKPTSTEELSWTLNGFAPLLAALAVVFVILELKTPGVGLWASLAGICGLLFFICQFYLELASYPEVILVVLGLVALGLEIFLLPTGGFLAIGGAALGLIGLVLAFMPDASQFAPDTPGWGNNLLDALISSSLAMVVASAGLVTLILALPRLAIARRMASTAEITATASSESTSKAGNNSPLEVGSHATARSDLAPNGYIICDGRELAAAAQHGEFIKAGTPVEIVGMQFGEALVRPIIQIVADTKATGSKATP
jgi:membrane-bound serine protease (ClpP class)